MIFVVTDKLTTYADVVIEADSPEEAKAIVAERMHSDDPEEALDWAYQTDFDSGATGVDGLQVSGVRSGPSRRPE